jgi:hypothetical protein
VPIKVSGDVSDRNITSEDTTCEIVCDCGKELWISDWFLRCECGKGYRVEFAVWQYDKDEKDYDNRQS